MDFKLFIDTLLTGTPIAILAALVGILWQAIYTRSRDRLHDEQIKRELELERQKFEYQKQLEVIRFEYEQRRWREELAREITVKLVEARFSEYTEVWSFVESISASHQMGGLTTETTKALAEKIKHWRYSKGGLLAEETTRDVAYVFQTALWEYDGSKESYRRMRQARRIFLEALRADTGLGENVTGQTIYEATEKRQKIHQELEELKTKLGISSKADAA